MRTHELCAKYGMTPEAVDALRQAMSGTFHLKVYDPEGNLKAERHAPNLVTNEGLDYALDVALSGGTQITAWKVALSKSTDAPAAGQTYAADGFTEISSTDVSESVRQAWVDGGVATTTTSTSSGTPKYSKGQSNSLLMMEIL